MKIASIILTLFVLFIGIGYIISNNTEEVITITVKDKVYHAKSEKYLIHAEGETFENVDTIFYRKWNSSDLYGAFDPGETYKVRVYGYRIPTMSTYRNIVEIVE